jgi:CheY-like chemotaxis protein
VLTDMSMCFAITADDDTPPPLWIVLPDLLRDVAHRLLRLHKMCVQFHYGPDAMPREVLASPLSVYQILVHALWQVHVTVGTGGALQVTIRSEADIIQPGSPHGSPTGSKSVGAESQSVLSRASSGGNGALLRIGGSVLARLHSRQQSPAMHTTPGCRRVVLSFDICVASTLSNNLGTVSKSITTRSPTLSASQEASNSMPRLPIFQNDKTAPTITGSTVFAPIIDRPAFDKKLRDVGGTVDWQLQRIQPTVQLRIPVYAVDSAESSTASLSASGHPFNQHTAERVGVANTHAVVGSHLIRRSLTSNPLQQGASTTDGAEATARLRKTDDLAVQLSSTVAPDTVALKALIVEDEVVNARIVNRHCQRAGWAVDVVYDGVDITWLDDANSATCTELSNQYACILLDIVMPKSDGAAVCIALRSIGFRGYIVAMTANTGQSDLQRYAEAGFNAVLGKPFTFADTERMLHAAQTHLHHRQHSSSPDHKFFDDEAVPGVAAM